jgi:hypothetical protein
MGHHETAENLSREEWKFRELMSTGEDFLKIEIYRSAIHRFRQAAAMNIDNDAANNKVAECEALIKKENRAIYAIVAVVAVVIAMVMMIR